MRVTAVGKVTAEAIGTVIMELQQYLCGFALLVMMQYLYCQIHCFPKDWFEILVNKKQALSITSETWVTFCQEFPSSEWWPFIPNVKIGNKISQMMPDRSMPSENLAYS